MVTLLDQLFAHHDLDKEEDEDEEEEEEEEDDDEDDEEEEEDDDDEEEDEEEDDDEEDDEEKPSKGKKRVGEVAARCCRLTRDPALTLQGISLDGCRRSTPCSEGGRSSRHLGDRSKRFEFYASYRSPTCPVIFSARVIGRAVRWLPPRWGGASGAALMRAVMRGAIGRVRVVASSVHDVVVMIRKSPRSAKMQSCSAHLNSMRIRQNSSSFTSVLNRRHTATHLLVPRERHADEKV